MTPQSQSKYPGYSSNQNYINNQPYGHSFTPYNTSHINNNYVSSNPSSGYQGYNNQYTPSYQNSSFK
jgi:hypothetical protein